MKIRGALKRLFTVVLEMYFLIALFSGAASASDEIHQRVITGFQSLTASESTIKIPADQKSTLMDATTLMPRYLGVYLDGESKRENIPVSWFCVSDDYERSEYYYYQFSPTWDETKYTLDPSVDLLTEAPYIAVFIIENVENEVSEDYMNGADSCLYKGKEYFCNRDDEDKLYVIETKTGAMRLVMNEHIITILTERNFLYALVYNEDESGSLIRFNMDTESHERIFNFADVITSMARRERDIYFATNDGVMKMDVTKCALSKLIAGNSISTLYFSDADTLKYYTKSGEKLEFLFVDQESELNNGSSDLFADVYKEMYYYNAVLWAADRNITKGKTKTLFDPAGICTRAQTVTFLWRFAGTPEPHAENPFLDINEDDYYYKAVIWAVEQGVTNGKSVAKFSPNDTVSRAQAVTFLYRMQGSKAADSECSFLDIAPNSYYENAVSWAVENSITNGKSETIFDPDDYCSRAQIVTFLYRLYNMSQFE